MLDGARRGYSGQGTRHQAAYWRSDCLVPDVCLRQCSNSGGRPNRTLQRGRQTRDDLVSEEDRLDGNRCQPLKVGRALLDDENNGQERMFSCCGPQHAKNWLEILRLEHERISIRGQAQELILVAGQNASMVASDCLYVRIRTRRGEDRDHQPAEG